MAAALQEMANKAKNRAKKVAVDLILDVLVDWWREGSGEGWREERER